MNARPRLRSHVVALRRGPGSLQLGLYPDTGVVLEGLSDAEIATVEALDGSVDISTLYADAAVAGVSASRLSALIATLDEHHLLADTTKDRICLSAKDEPPSQLRTADAKALAAAYGLPGDGYPQVTARAGQHVVISADGELPHALADLLRAGGIGLVSVGADAVNLLDLELRSHRVSGTQYLSGATRDLSGFEHDRAGAAPPTFATMSSTSSMSSMPDLVILAAMGAIRPEAGEPWRRHGIPHLPLVVQGHRVQIGPLILGRDGPCLTCLDLHRRDRDAAWPALLSQLACSQPAGERISLESTLTAMTIGAVAMMVHTRLDGQSVPDDVSLELSLPWPTVQQRRWFAHPLCDCLVGQATMTG